MKTKDLRVVEYEYIQKEQLIKSKISIRVDYLKYVINRVKDNGREYYYITLFESKKNIDNLIDEENTDCTFRRVLSCLLD